MAAAYWSSWAHRYSRCILRQPSTPNLFLDKEDRRTLKSQIEPASAVPGEERCTLHARCDFWCFSSLSTPCLSPSAPLGMGILKALPGYYSSVRSVPGMGLAVYLGMHVFNFVYSPFLPFYGYASSSSSPTGLFLNYGMAPGYHRGTEEMAMAAPPCCPTSLRAGPRGQRGRMSYIRRCPFVSQSCVVEGAPGHNRWRVAETPLPAKSQGRTRSSYDRLQLQS